MSLSLGLSLSAKVGGGGLAPAVILSIATGFTADYFAQDTITISGTCAPGATVNILNNGALLGAAAKPTPTTFELVHTISMTELNATIYLGNASIVAVPSAGKASDPVTGTFTALPELYPGLLACLDPSQVYAGVGSWGRVMAVQPDQTDLDMESAGTGAYVGVNATLSKVAGAYAGSQCLRVDATAALGYARKDGMFITGNRYVTPGWGQAGPGGGARVSVTSGATSSLNTTANVWTAVITPEETAAGTVLRLYSNVNGTYALFDAFSSTNISVVNVYSRGATGTFAQATAASMPYLGTGINGYATVCFDGAADRLVSDQSAAYWKAMHAAAGSVSCAIFAVATGAAADGYLFATHNATVTGVSALWDATNKRVVYVVGNAGAVLTLNSATNGVLANNAAHVATASFTEVTGGTLRVDAAAAVTGACGGCSAADPATTMAVGSRGDAASWIKARVGFKLDAAGATAVARESKLHTWARARAAI